MSKLAGNEKEESCHCAAESRTFLLLTVDQYSEADDDDSKCDEAGSCPMVAVESSFEEDNAHDCSYDNNHSSHHLVDRGWNEG